MAKVFDFFGKGSGELLEVVEQGFEATSVENGVIKEVIETIMALTKGITDQQSRLEALIQIQESKLEDVLDMTTEISAIVNESKTTNHVGKIPKFLDSARSEVEELSNKQIRELINRAANRQQKGYTRLYSKLAEITGVDIYAVGKTDVKSGHGLGFTNGNKTYINTVFREGIHKEAAMVSLDILRNK